MAPSAPASFAAIVSSATRQVMMPPVPAMTGTLPFIRSAAIPKSRRRSSGSRAQDSPLDPETITPSAPSETRSSMFSRNIASSMSPPFVNGVITAGKLPVQSTFPSFMSPHSLANHQNPRPRPSP